VALQAIVNPSCAELMANVVLRINKFLTSHGKPSACVNTRRSGEAIRGVRSHYGTKWPKAVAKITDDRDELLAFYDFPAEHWVHLRTTNPIETTFSTVKLRTKVTRGAGSPAAALAMVFKLVESAQARWRAITGAHLVPSSEPAQRSTTTASSSNGRTRPHDRIACSIRRSLGPRVGRFRRIMLTLIGTLGGVFITALFGLLTAHFSQRWQYRRVEQEHRLQIAREIRTARREAYARVIVAAQALFDKAMAYYKVNQAQPTPTAEYLAPPELDKLDTEFEIRRVEAFLLASAPVQAELDTYTDWLRTFWPEAASGTGIFMVDDDNKDHPYHHMLRAMQTELTPPSQ
jgi:hypothetical protein